MFLANSYFYLSNFRRNYIVELSRAGHDVTVVIPDEDLPNFDFSDDVRVASIKLDRGSINPIRELITLVQMYRIIRLVRPDFALSSTPKINIYSALICSVLSVRSVLNISGLGSTFLRGGIYRAFVWFLYSISLSRAYHIFFENKFDYRLFKERKLLRSNASIIPGLGVDVDFFRPKRAGEVERIDFLMISRFIKDKGVVEFIKACESLSNNVKNVKCCLMGDFDLKNPSSISREQMEEINKAGSVEIIPFKSDVRPFIANSRCIVLPSYREGLSRVLLEAGAMGKPSITTNVPGCCDVVIDGHNGYLCTARSSADLHKCLVNFLNLSALEQEQMGVNARKNVVSNFSEGIVSRAYDAVIFD
jgi:glycosyltransferase involved in cell wall biosynthesis